MQLLYSVQFNTDIIMTMIMIITSTDGVALMAVQSVTVTDGWIDLYL